MFPRKAMLLGLSSCCLIASASVDLAPASASQSCVLDKYRPESATPYVVEESAGYDMYAETRGAQLFVPAQPGLTRQWLQLTLERALLNQADASGAEACHLAAKLDKIGVTPAGDGFWVQLIGHDEHTAKELLSWAKNVVQRESARATASK